MAQAERLHRHGQAAQQHRVEEMLGREPGQALLAEGAVSVGKPIAIGHERAQEEKQEEQNNGNPRIRPPGRGSGAFAAHRQGFPIASPWQDVPWVHPIINI